MRQYAVTTNTDIVLELPALTVTVRAAFYVPYEVVPKADEGVVAGRETWVGGKPVFAFFQMSQLIASPKDKVALKDVLDLDGKKIQAVSKSRRAGVATDVLWSDAKQEGAYKVPRKYVGQPKTVGQAQIPLWGVKRGSYVLAIVPPEKEQTKPDEPAGPKTTIEPGVDFTYRKLYVLLTFDDELNLVKAATIQLVNGSLQENARINDPAGKLAGYTINHGYVTGFSRSELAIDLKPDFVRTVRTNDAHKAATESGKWARDIDMIVVHGTSGPLIGNALNTALGPIADEGRPYGPHYEIDRDGHNLKFAYDDGLVSHAGPSNVFFPEKGAYSSNIGNRSIGIEVVNWEGDAAPGGGHAQEPYREQQILALIRLLGALVAAHPKVDRRRIVGHVDVKCVYSKAAKAFTTMDDSRLSCPGRQMAWPRLEQAGFGRVSVKKTLAATDYSGIFSLAVADFPEKFPGKPGPAGIFLRAGDSDTGEKWSGIKWNTKEAKELLKKKGLTFKGIVLEMQKDLQTLGYFVGTNGELDNKTELALKHYIWHTFSGDRRSEVPGGNGFSPQTVLNQTVAQYLKGAAERILADIGSAAAVKAAAAGAAAGAAGGATPPAPPPAPAKHAELEPELTGDVHDRREADEGLASMA
jgi:N-acetyl-anhydromuramyl-L-alanine amidase AmpD